ncbi:MAG TPA: hypothetical protein VK747_19985, partial [Blastocatellia bacterium]|nr:hypothetical protein [Blastocatellia bacterium]
ILRENAEDATSLLGWRFTVAATQGRVVGQRMPRDKPVASRASLAIVLAAIVNLQRDKPVASSEVFTRFLARVGMSARQALDARV